MWNNQVFSNADNPSIQAQRAARIVPGSNADIKSKLHLYKTAFSPTYDRYVEIISIREDEDGEPIIKARLPKRESPGPGFERPGYVLFRMCELKDWCL